MYDKIFVLQTGDSKVFSDLRVLETKPAHMAIFMHYVLTHHNPAPLLFYQMTSLYMNAQGSCKDLKKWAYEIHSTFIVHSAVSKTKPSVNIVLLLEILYIISIIESALF
jgi:hypothetical protein